MTLSELISRYAEKYPGWEWLVRTNADQNVPLHNIDPTKTVQPALYFVCLNKHGIRRKAYAPTAEEAFSLAMAIMVEQGDGETDTKTGGEQDTM